MKYILSMIMLLSMSYNVFAGTRVLVKKSQSFQACIATIALTAKNLKVAPVNIVHTNIVKIVRFPTNDGSGKSILITCSKPDHSMIINESW